MSRPGSRCPAARRAARHAATLALWACVALLAASTAAERASQPVVIVLSFDGLRHDMPSRGGLPGLERMAREGARAEALVPVFPTDTFPNHVSLATGTFPDRHGIVANRFLDPQLGLFDYGNDARFLDAEPIWATAERQGVRAAVFFWVGSETPWQGVAATHRRAPFDSGVGEDAKVDQILAWWDLPPAKRPGLVMSWWHGADHPGHRHGPDAEEVGERLRQQDAALGRLLAGLDARDAWGSTTLLVVGDHGMTALGPSSDLRELLGDHGVAGRVFHAGGTARIHLNRPEQAGEVVALVSRLEGVQAWPRDALPEAFRYAHPTRIGHVLALAEPPRHFTRAGGRRDRWQKISAVWGNQVGGHGYRPTHPDMAAGFLALGRGVPSGRRLGRVRSIDLAATVARGLGIEPPAHSEGVAISPLFEAASPASRD